MPRSRSGKEVGLRVGVIARPTREEALQAAANLLEDAKIRDKQQAYQRASDSESIHATRELAAREEWLTPWLWAGAVPYHGAPTISLVGTPEEVASGFMEYRAVGVSQFILHGWPKLDEMLFFGREVLPLVRREERRARRRAAGSGG